MEELHELRMVSAIEIWRAGALSSGIANGVEGFGGGEASAAAVSPAASSLQDLEDTSNSKL